MCTTCGCGEGDTRIDGQAPHDRHEHPHRHADGSVHSHPHAHEGEHAHPHDRTRRALARHDGTTARARAHAHAGRHAAQPRPRRRQRPRRGPRPAAALLDAVHAAGAARERIVQIEQDILAKNDAYARENRRHFADHGIFALNLVSSPGSGKTSLLVRTIEAWQGRTPVAVIEGDQQTSLDADRIRATGAPADPDQHRQGLPPRRAHGRAGARAARARRRRLLLIENVGNLVCPAAFDLGEAHKVVILSVTEGEDKPLKYPDMFRAADLMLVNKADLLPLPALRRRRGDRVRAPRAARARR